MRHAKRQKIDNSNIAKMVYASDLDNCEITDLMSVNHQCLNFAKKKVLFCIAHGLGKVIVNRVNDSIIVTPIGKEIVHKS